jgi:hypothetical protein
VIVLTQKGVEVFINKYNKENQISFWNNYDLVIWKKNISGYTSTKGLFKNNSWGTADIVSVNNQGLWKLSGKYVKYFR